jgi:hypothetical protein
LKNKKPPDRLTESFSNYLRPRIRGTSEITTRMSPITSTT